MLLAVIGPRWLTAADPIGRRRIDDPADWIRRELVEAFAAGVRVIPVLADQAELPAEADLPADIAALGRCQHRHLRRREPTSDLARIVSDLTSLDPVLAAAVKRRDNAPRQLLAAPVGFVGRADHLAELDRALTPPKASSEIGGQAGGATVVISAIGGTGGIGKTWLALTWAHRNLHRFPDGQLSVDLRGFSPAQPRAAIDVLADFLAALGVDRDHQPQGLDARVALYRTRTTGKRMLILLDNAATPDQIVPLLPGGDSCTVLITSRNQLRSLIARHSARPVHLDVLTDAEARTLLTNALGDTDDRVDTGWAVTELVGLCAGFPLALGLIAAQIRTHSDLLENLVTDLHELGLDALDSDDPTASLPTVLSWSLRHLTDHQRTLFGLLGIAPGPDATLPAVATLTDVPLAHARTALCALEEASLLERRPGGRYAMHDLVRDYAAATARELRDDVREAALTRVMDFHLHTAHAADRLLDPHRQLLRPDPPAAGVHPLPLSNAAAAMAWLEAEHTTLLATQRAAVVLDRHAVVWYLAWVLNIFHIQRGHRRDALTAWEAAFEAASHLPDPAACSRTHRHLGNACSRLGLHEEAIRHMGQALELAVRHHDLTEQAHTHQLLVGVWARQGDDRQALDHARHSLNLYRAIEQPAWEADALNAVGWLAACLGEFDIARDHCRAAVTLLRRHNDHQGGGGRLGQSRVHRLPQR